MNDRLKELMLKAGYAAPEIAGRANKFAELMIKGRDSKGNVITENSVEKIVRHREEA